MKIPKEYKDKPVIAIGNYAIWCDSLALAMKVASRLSTKDKNGGIPCMGKIQVLGENYYWCRYGFLNDPDIYTK